jgi:hypothetical protein
VSALLSRPECARTGLYVLLGGNPAQPDGVLAYIGEADDVAARLRNHLRSETKDFFERVAVVVSSDENLTKAHVRYLESELIRRVLSSGSVALANETRPPAQRLPEADRADMEQFSANLEILLPLLGFDLFRRMSTGSAAATDTDAGAIFTFETAGARARARETEDGFLILAGSSARREPSSTFPAGYRVHRDRLVAAGDLVDGAGPELLTFTRDTRFASPSAAASIVAARAASGPLEWRVEGSGQRYRDWLADRIDREASSSPA